MSLKAEIIPEGLGCLLTFLPSHEVILGADILVPDGDLDDPVAVLVLLAPGKVPALPPLGVDRAADGLGLLLLLAQAQLAVGVAADAGVHGGQVAGLHHDHVHDRRPTEVLEAPLPAARLLRPQNLEVRPQSLKDPRCWFYFTCFHSMVKQDLSPEIEIFFLEISTPSPKHIHTATYISDVTSCVTTL